ncbi:MAG: PAS domain-containing protein [Deltaproteobacteria bacterium]|jgi:two-component system phosphate regulon sensor histidine kinase PhoR|nr:PAS domain-containing protein [Deltaproteobacteria bacterium]
MKTTQGSLRFRLFLAFALVTVVAVGAPALLSRNALYEERLKLVEEEALNRAFFAQSLLESSPSGEQLQRIFASAAERSFRLTLLDASGRVLRDSHIEETGLADLDNHGDRPEIEAARADGFGLSSRWSNSLGIEAVYAAVSLKDGGMLRVGVSLASVRKGLEAQFSRLGFVVLLTALLCLVLSAFITRRVRDGLDSMAEAVGAISRHRGKRLLDVPGREFLPLACAVNHMADSIEQYMETTADQQSQLETILDSMHEGVLVLGPSGRIRRWNKRLAELFPAVSHARGSSLIEGLPVPALQRRVDELLAGGDSIAEGEAALHFEMPAGRFLVAHISSPVERNDSLGLVIVIYDATEIMRLERVRRDFVANVSHELRTPLTAVAGYAETLTLCEDLKDEYRNFAGIIYKHASMLGKTIGDLLSLARIEDAREEAPLAPTDASLAFAEASAACGELLKAKGLRVAADMDGPTVMANAPLLAQVFRNLLENACRYSPEGGVVRVTAARREDAVLFTVADNGPGIPREALPRIFERFYQVKKERNSGTAGIGLAICKHIVERCGGRIWAESPHGEAATAMMFTLPAAGADRREEA